MAGVTDNLSPHHLTAAWDLYKSFREEASHLSEVLKLPVTPVLHIALADDGEHIGDHGSRSFCRASWKTSCVLVSLFWSS